MPPFTILVSFIHIPSLSLNVMNLCMPSLMISHKPLASSLFCHPARNHFYSWVIMSPSTLKGISYQHSWTLRLFPIFFACFIRPFDLHSGWFFSSFHFILALHFFGLFSICFLGACLSSLLLSLCTNMWRRSRAPCSCLNCTSEEL
jgi:hypothetical protein